MQLEQLLISLGGTDMKQSVHNMLRRVISDSLALKLSFTGRSTAGKKKEEFREKKICKCIFAAAQNVFGTAVASEDNVKTVISRWLQKAKSRVDSSKKTEEKAKKEEGVRSQLQPGLPSYPGYLNKCIGGRENEATE
ncbi:uncharacterized protein LOC129005595 isoform X2 [Macrosteles quadrilineatus]|uniref:uncharacterized protein LOC129005595 isoform X2 n=1 Tax=Macrosteles quadrilineatus TaxID=74068 RepID=UPI0023E20725|nr:uncharacterized protein LOC129005595 isoform X2 [Macrosteles quadrilineatus]